jgi:hypothetical protein
VNKFVAELQAGTSLRPEDVERLTMSLSMNQLMGLEAGGVRAILLLSRPHDWRRVQRFLEQKHEHYEERSYRGKKMMVQVEKKPALAVCAFNDKVLLCGTEPDVKTTLDEWSARRKQEGPLHPAVKLAAGKHLATFGIHPARKDLEGLAEFGHEEWKPLTQLETATITVDRKTRAGAAKQQDTFQIELQMAFADEPGAIRGEKAARALADFWVDAVKRFPQLNNLPAFRGMLLTPLEAANWDRKGSSVHLSLQVQWQEKAVNEALELNKHLPK